MSKSTREGNASVAPHVRAPKGSAGGEVEATEIDISNPLCQADPTCGFHTTARNVQRAMERHYADHSGVAG